MKTTYTAQFFHNDVNSCAPMGSNKNRAFDEAMRIAEIYWKEGDTFQIYIVSDNDKKIKMFGGINAEGEKTKLNWK